MATPQVLAWLEAFVEAFDLRRLIHFNTRVTDLQPLAQSEANGGRVKGTACVAEQAMPQWSLTSESTQAPEEVSYMVYFQSGLSWASHGGQQDGRIPHATQGCTQTTQVFDAVVVAIGNYHEPNLVRPGGQARHWMAGSSYAGMQRAKGTWHAAGGGRHAELPRDADALPQLPACASI